MAAESRVLWKGKTCPQLAHSQKALILVLLSIFKAAGILTAQSVALPTIGVTRFAPDNTTCTTRSQELP